MTLFVSRGKQPVPVPNVVGQDLTTALTELAAVGLQPKITRIYSSAQSDTVTADGPHAGDKVVKGTIVHINVSRGAKPVPVPDVTGQPYANAKSALEGAGFVVSRADVQSDMPQGVVVSEDPQQGSPEPKGTTITLSVSQGPAATQVPDVVGESQTNAEQTLVASQLTPAVSYIPVTDPSRTGWSMRGPEVRLAREGRRGDLARDRPAPAGSAGRRRRRDDDHDDGHHHDDAVSRRIAGSSAAGRARTRSRSRLHAA